MSTSDKVSPKKKQLKQITRLITKPFGGRGGEEEGGSRQLSLTFHCLVIGKNTIRS